MDKCIDLLGEALIFSALDVNSGYWQEEIDKRDRYKTASTSHHGFFQFVRRLVGLKNASDAFQRAMDDILPSKNWN